MTAPIRPSRPREPAEPVRQESLRALNLELVFRHILAAGRPVSRTELAAGTGLTRPTITRIVDELRAGRLITEAGLTHDGRAGRPRVGLTVSEQGPAGLGLDIRADGLAACVVDLTGRVRHLAFAPSAASDQGAPVPAAAVGADPGAIGVDNEAKLAALGELYASHNMLDSFVYVSGGLGIGAGIVLNGQLMRGARGWSGELGHVTVHPDGKPCPCGSRGCLQTYASLDAILGDTPVLGGATPEATIAARADAGAEAVLAALDTAGTALGIAVSDMLNILDVDTVLLGGSFALLASWLTANASAEINQRVLTAAWAPVTIRPALLGPDAAVIGAALTAIDQIRQRPTTWLSMIKASL